MHNNSLSKVEMDNYEETCIVTSWEWGHCSESEMGGQNSAHSLSSIAAEPLNWNNAIFLWAADEQLYSHV